MRTALAWLALTCVAGCELSQPSLYEDEGATRADAAARGPRGSQACQAWQSAFCDFTSDRCGLLPRLLCDRQNQGVVCVDDTQVLECASAFDEAPCQRPPPDCAVADVADARQAILACETYFDTLCESNVRCGLFEDVEECGNHPQFAFDCDGALSISLDYEACLETLQTRRCDRGAPICDNVVRSQSP